MSHNSQKSLDFSWHEDKTIRADIITNKQIAVILIKIVLFFFVVCYSSRMLPDAQIVTTYTPQIWKNIDTLQVHDVGPLNRNLKVYAAPANASNDIDMIYQVQVYSLLDSEQKEQKLDLKINDLDQYTDIQQNQLRFYFGDVHILDEVAYRVKVFKPRKVQRILQEQNKNQQQNTKQALYQKQYLKDQQQNQVKQTLGQNSSNQQVKNNNLQQQKIGEQQKFQNKEEEQNQQKKPTQEQQNKTKQEQQNQQNRKQEQKKNEEQQQKQKKQQEQKRQQEQQKKRLEQQQQKRLQEQQRVKKQQEQRKKMQQQKKRLEQQQEKRKQQEQRKKKEEQQARQKQIEEQQRKKAEAQQNERRRKIQQYTNIRIQVHIRSSFATILELIIRYISVLVIIYMATDNSDGPLTIALICGIISNPLLFLHISYPNRVSNVIDCLCKSGHMLYFFIWVYYIHTKSKFADKIQYRVYLAIKMVFCSLIYILNFIRLLHYQVGIVESLITVIVLFMLCLYLWDAYLNLQYQHHRDKILVSVTLTFLGCLFAFKFLSRHWKNQMTFIIYQVYGLLMLYLMSSPKQPRQAQTSKFGKAGISKQSKNESDYKGAPQYEDRLGQENQKQMEKHKIALPSVEMQQIQN